MAYIIRASTDLYQCDDSVVAAYVTAGWVQATAAQILAWAAGDSYGGTQGAPPAPPLLNASTGTAPAPLPSASN